MFHRLTQNHLHRLRFFEIARMLNFGVSLPELMAACAARGLCAACYGFGFVRNGAATAFHVFYRFQVTRNFDDAPLLQSAPNRPDYIHIWALWLHGHQFVAAFALG